MFDVAKHLGAITRAVESTTHDGKPAKVVVASRTYPTSPDDLWDAVTDPERIPRWFAAVRATCGSAAATRSRATQAARSSPATRPPTSPLPGRSAAGCWVDITSRPCGGGGARRSPCATPPSTRPGVLRQLRSRRRRRRLGPQLMGLAEHLATGATMGPTAEAWGATDDGRDFMAQPAMGRAPSRAVGTDARPARPPTRTTNSTPAPSRRLRRARLRRPRRPRPPPHPRAARRRRDAASGDVARSSAGSSASPSPR